MLVKYLFVPNWAALAVGPKHWIPAATKSSTIPSNEILKGSDKTAYVIERHIIVLSQKKEHLKSTSLLQKGKSLEYNEVARKIMLLAHF